MSADDPESSTAFPKTARINGREIDLRPGDNILAAAGRLGIEIPTLCHDPAFAPEGACRLCVVHSAHHDAPLAACHTPLEAGMELQTHHVRVEKLRRSVLQLHLESAGSTGLDLAEVRRGPFLDLLDRYRVRDPIGRRSRARRGKERGKEREHHPMIRFHEAACIGCRACLTSCDQIAGRHVFQLEGRAATTRVRPSGGADLRESPCTACGACVDRCPTGAVIDRDRNVRWRVENEERSTDSVCGYCSVGCRVRIDAIDGNVRRIEGIREAAATNPDGLLCQKGRFAHVHNLSWERLDRPMLRQGAGFREIDWDEAFAVLEKKLGAILEAHGPGAFGAIASPRASTESNYLLQKLCRAVVGSPHIDSSARYCHAETAGVMRDMLGVSAATASFADIDRAGCLVLAGADPDTSHPVLAARIQRAVADGARLVVIDPRRTEMAERADLFLQPRPGSDLGVLAMLLRALREACPELGNDLENADAFAETLARFPFPVSEADGSITAAAELLSQHLGQTLFLCGTGLSRQGRDALAAFLDLALLTCDFDRPGSGILPLGGQNNLQGCLDAGAAPDRLPGGFDIDDAEARARLESLWGKPLPAGRGWTAPEMIEAATRGELRALWVMGHEAGHAHPDAGRTRAGLEALDFLVIQDLFYTESARHADLLLPAASGFEQDGIFINAERRMQRIRAAVPPPGEARPDWAIIGGAARRLGASWPPYDAADLWREIARVAPESFGGVSHRRLEESPAGLQWPCPTTDHPGSERLRVTRRRLHALPVSPELSGESPDEEFPFLLLVGRKLQHHNAGTETRRGPGRFLVDRDAAAFSPEDAAALGLAAGVRVRLRSRHGEVTVACETSEQLASGQVFLSHHFPQANANLLTSHLSGAVAIRVEKLPEP